MRLTRGGAGLAAVLVLAGCPETSSDPLVDGSAGAGGYAGSGTPVDECDLDGDDRRSPSCGGDDCNDRDPRVHPGATERCDGTLDHDCDGSVDEGCACAAGDARPCYPPGDEDPTRQVGACADGWQLCSADGLTWSTCDGAVTPSPEDGAPCDGVDQDCDGVPDDGLANACGSCGPAPIELCGNLMDDDCDGRVDPPELCNVTCEGVDVDRPDPPGLACCFHHPDEPGQTDRPVPFSARCVEFDGLPACESEERRCLDLDGDPASTCAKLCVDDDNDGVIELCLCGEPRPGERPARTAACGFETPCALLGCEGRSDQPCYTGNPLTLGKGICHGGRASCGTDDDGQRAWASCEGEQLPGVEVCGDGLDNDCDGSVDEEDGSTHRRCDLARCSSGAFERCGDGEDNDCDGAVDEACPANAEEQACFTGPPGTRGVGACRDGVQKRDGEFWGVCEGAVPPSAERCQDGVDSDCDGFGGPDSGAEDAGCCEPAGVEVCNGVDDDCDGLTDEGLLSACGTCDDAPCFTEEFLDPANCLEGNGRLCDRIIADESNPDAFSVSTDKVGGGADSAIYFALYSTNRLSKFDTVTGEKLWEVESHGDSPSRTGVALDNTVWLGNRGFRNSNDTAFSNTVHFDRNGNVICLAETPGMPRGLAIDAAGDVWIGTYVSKKLLKVSGSGVGAPGPDGLPRCDLIDLTPNDPATMGPDLGVTSYGAEFARDGFTFWANSLGSEVVRWDTQLLTKEVLDTSCSATFDIAVDGNGDAWVGCENQVVRLNGTGPYLDRNVWETPTGTVGRGITVGDDGTIWAAAQKTLVRIDPVTLASVQYPIPGPGTTAFSAAPDAAQKIWVVSWTQSAYRFDPITLKFDVYNLGAATYARSDLTGARLRVRFARQGSWTQFVDSGYASTEWRRLDWQQQKPAGSKVDAYVRFASTREALETTGLVCGPYTEPPVDLAPCVGDVPARFAAVNFLLRPSQEGTRPTVGNVRLSWTRP